MRIQLQPKLCSVILVALLVAGSSCSLTAITKGKGTAEDAVAQFHNQYNAGQFREIYDQADEAFKKSGSDAEFIPILEAMRRKLGTVKHAEQAGWHVNATTEGTFVTLGYTVEFSEGKGTEQFVFRIRGDKAALYNFNVNSPLLITK